MEIRGAGDRNIDHASMEMVPITKELLQEHYKQFPDPSLGNAVRDRSQKVRDMRLLIMKSVTAESSNQSVAAIVDEPIPTGLDNMMYTIRCACEEAAQQTAVHPNSARLTPPFQSVANGLEQFQLKQSQHVSSVISEFLPKDFRGSFFSVYRHRSEKANQQAIDDLSARGGTVREKYALLWDQQWKRRESLAMIGNASGVWKLLMRYLAGVPTPLLAFAENINSANGPTEALRSKFGTVLRQLAMVAVEMNALTAAMEFGGTDKAHKVLEACLLEYQKEVDSFVVLLNRVIVNSPFFVRADEIAQLKADGE